MRRSFVAVIALVIVFGGAAPIQAEKGTRCTFEFEVTLSPGLSMSPSSGTHRGTGPLTCDGLVNGKQPTGTGTLTDDGRYGTKDPDTCSGGEGDGVDTMKIPTQDGIETVISEFTFTYPRPSTKGGVAGGEFKGTHFTGSFEFTPMEGDCISAPVTKVRVFGEGVLHG